MDEQRGIRIDEAALDAIFRIPRSVDNFLDRPVPDEVLRAVYELARLPPTSSNSQPMRMLFLKTPEARQRLAPALSSGNREKTLRAPATAIIAYDLAFYTHLGRMFHTKGAESWFIGKDDVIQDTAFRNGTLQAAYFMLAARALGLDVGPMSGFDKVMVDAEFFTEGEYRTWRSNFVCNLGYGDPEGLPPRDPRFAFDEACHMI
jgi:3-hydroxypropanoate dehydrogenase